MNDDKVVDLMHRHARLLSLRSSYDAAWRDLAEHFLPTKFRDVAKTPNAYKGENIINPRLINTTGVLAIRTLAAGLQGGMTSPARPWFSLMLEKQEFQDIAPLKDWLDDVQQRMRTMLSRSNFYNVVHSMYADLATFGTAFVLLLADFDDGVRFVPFSVGEFCIDTNAQGKVDVVFRRFQMSARQLVQQFGKDKMPPYVLECSSKKRRPNEERFTVVHAIYPRKQHAIYDERTPNEMPYASVYYLDGITGHGASDTRTFSGMKGHVLSESGFEEFPGFGVRWDVSSNDVYGRSPAMDVLADCKMLQQIDIATLKAIHKAVDPPTAVTASLKATGLDLTPGGVNYVETQPGMAPQAATPILQTAPEIKNALLFEEKIEQHVKDGLYNDLFRMLMDSGRKQITATEIAAKEDEKLILIGPMLERLNNELFIPLIGRLYAIMKRLDMLPELPQLPEEYGNIEIRVHFVSLLAQAQKAVGIGGIDRLMAFLASTAQMYPEVLDSLNVDKTVDEYAENLGVTPNLLKSTQEREEVRAERKEAGAQQDEAQAQQNQQAQTMQALKGAGDLAFKLSQSNLDGNSALNAILGSGASGVL